MLHVLSHDAFAAPARGSDPADGCRRSIDVLGRCDAAADGIQRVWREKLGGEGAECEGPKKAGDVSLEAWYSS